MRVQAILPLLLPLALTGCSLTGNPPSTPTPFRLNGSVYGAQQPIAGAHIYLFAAAASGYNKPSISLLDPAITGHSDSVGTYVLSTAGGGFAISGQYCSSGQQVYLYVLGGNSGAGTNPVTGLLAALGTCPSTGTFDSSLPSITVNEVTTVAAAYALAGFATDATHISSSGTPLALTGISNAFANASNLAMLSTGSALFTTPSGGTASQTQTNLLANILASCVNSTGAISGPTKPTTCYTLFHAATSDSTTSGVIPTDTATAAINIAHHPGNNFAALYALAPASPTFQPVPLNPSGDFTETVSFSATIRTPIGFAIDGGGNIWIASASTASIVELSSLGAVRSPPAGFTGGGIYQPDYIAIDPTGNVWATNHEPGVSPPGAVKLSPSGTPLSPAVGFTGGGLNTLPSAIAVDGSGNAWIVDVGGGAITEFSSGGVPLSPSTAFRGGGLNSPSSIAIDSNGNAWLGSYNTVAEFSSTGLPLSPSTGFRGGGINDAFSIAIDHANNVWVGNANANSISEFSNAGVALSSASGSTGGGLDDPQAIAIDGDGNVWAANTRLAEFSTSGAALSPAQGYSSHGGGSSAIAIAVDGSGNLWTTNDALFGGMTEFIGIAAPVVTPLSYGVAHNTLGTRP